MIKMCDLPRYADADMEEIKKMKEAHTVLNQVTYEPKPLYHGYTDKRLRINVTDNTIDMIDIPQEVKEKFTGGKGYCLCPLVLFAASFRLAIRSRQVFSAKWMELRIFAFLCSCLRQPQLLVFPKRRFSF